jgi:hypothetical protein
MEVLQFTKDEMEDMKQFYLEEYERTRSRLKHIELMLQKLGEKVPDAPAADRVKTPKKRGRKSKWEMLVMKRMRQLGRPVTYDQLTEEILTSSRLPEEKRASTRQAVVNVVFRLRNRDQKLDTFSMGSREKYIALKSWFKSPGVIKKEYARKIVD